MILLFAIFCLQFFLIISLGFHSVYIFYFFLPFTLTSDYWPTDYLLTGPLTFDWLFIPVACHFLYPARQIVLLAMYWWRGSHDQARIWCYRQQIWKCFQEEIYSLVGSSFDVLRRFRVSIHFVIIYGDDLNFFIN